MFRKNCIITILFLFLACVNTHADGSHWPSVTAGAAYCYLTNTDNMRDLFVDRNGHMSYTFKVGFNTSPDDPNAAFAERYNYPVLGFGATFDNCTTMKFKNNSRLGNFLNVYTFMEGAFYKNKYGSIGYWASIGMGITSVMYDPITNPYQLHIGAPLSIYLTCGPQIKLRPVDNFELAINAYWYHHSNGNMWMSNIGLNGYAVGATLTYNIDKPYTKQVSRLTLHPEYEKGMHYDFFTTYGLHACKTEFKAFNEMVEDPEEKQKDFRSRPRIGLGFDAVYRYSLLCSTGLSLEAGYNWDSEMLKRSDTVIYGPEAVAASKGYSPFSLALGFVHEFYYGNVTAYMGCSAYLFRHVGINEDISRYYQRIGMRFYFPHFSNAFAGWNIRSTKFKNADFFEFQIGIRI